MFYILYDTSNKTKDPISTSHGKNFLRTYKFVHWQNIMPYISPLRFLYLLVKCFEMPNANFRGFCLWSWYTKLNVHWSARSNTYFIDIINGNESSIKLWFSLNQWKWETQFKTSIPTLQYRDFFAFFTYNVIIKKSRVSI